MDTTLLIILICVGVLLLTILFYYTRRFLKKFKKPKTVKGELSKKLSKLGKPQKHNKKAKKPLEKVENKQKEVFSLDKPIYEEEIKPDFSKIKHDFEISDYVEDAPQVEKQEEPHEQPQRKSFAELMRAREEAKSKYLQDNAQAIEEEEAEEFEKFRANHSIYTTFEQDKDLVNEIQNLSPELKAIVFGNLFRRVSDD